MKMILTSQRIKVGKRGVDLCSGQAAYLSDMPVEVVDIHTAEFEFCNAFDEMYTQLRDRGYQSSISLTELTIDGATAQWGCIVDFKALTDCLPLSYGFED